MEEIKINPNKLINGEYIRTNRGTFDRYITKHKDSSNDYSWYIFENRGNITNPENYVVKHSLDITKVLETGDIIEHKIYQEIFKSEIYITNKDEIFTTDGYRILPEEIISVETHEQFNQVKYEV